MGFILCDAYASPVSTLGYYLCPVIGIMLFIVLPLAIILIKFIKSSDSQKHIREIQDQVTEDENGEAEEEKKE